MLNSNFVGYVMLFSARSLDGSLRGMMNGIARILHVLAFWGVCLLWFSGMERTGKGREMKGTVWTFGHVW
ncbi:hypothetical protein HZ326_22191 [Fusarium oxysporum f. sp. albedinis]|nr:hypothetical protein HZ326_22191 [Fusarium oxysporum f. sp. albedinis]